MFDMRSSLVVVALAACTGGDGTINDPLELPVGGCDGILHSIPDEGGEHRPVGSIIEWSSNPPASGPHFPSWAGWDRHYANNLERGYYLHNAEHGGVILLYNCPEGCPEVVEKLLTVAREAAPDNTCTAPVTKRVIVAADPLLEPGVQVAAVAWNRYYTASCFDPYVETFMRTQYRHAPEDLCTDGAPFGGVPIPLPPM